MDAEELRKVERVDARLVWSHEALEFTPWLEEHIDELAERIGVELQIDAREVEVGPFAADLVGRDVTTGAGLLIENQLGATDHGHLGQLITYAAGLDTRVMVWISTEIREEHRQAVDWLNDATREEYNFFAVRVELLKIGGQCAPDFVILASPNTWQKRVRSATSGRRAGAARDERYREIWGRFIEKLRAKDRSATRARSGPNGNWFNTPGGFVVTFSRQGPRVELYLDYGDADRTKAVFDALLDRNDEIEARVGKPLSWERLDERQASRVALYTDGSADLTGTEMEVLLESSGGDAAPVPKCVSWLRCAGGADNHTRNERRRVEARFRGRDGVFHQPRGRPLAREIGQRPFASPDSRAGSPRFCFSGHETASRKVLSWSAAKVW